MCRVIQLVGFVVCLGVTIGWAQPVVDNYTLDVTFEPERSFMSGRAVITFVDPLPGDSVVFFVHGELRVDSILGPTPIEYTQDQVFYARNYSLIAIRVAMSLEPGTQAIEVYYNGYFHPSKTRSPSDYMRIDADGAFLRAYGYSLWFPIFIDDAGDMYACDFEVAVRTPEDMTAVFAGERLSDEVVDGTRVSRWRAEKLSLHAAQCTAQRYLVTVRPPVYLYHYDDSASVAAAGEIAAFARAISERFRAYYRSDAAAGQYHIMEMPRYGDISSGNVTGISAGLWRGFEDNIWGKRGLAHEFVHPFVRTGVAQANPLFALEIEGFPSYFHLPVLAESLGEAWLDSLMRRVETAYLRKRETGLGWRDRAVPPEKPLVEIAPDEVGLYKDSFVLDDRALLCLHWIRRQLGPDRFYEFTRALLTGGPLTLETFKATVVRFLPDAGELVDLWLTTTDYPPSIRLNSD